MKSKQELIDLTHVVSSKIPGWDKDTRFDVNITHDYGQGEGIRFRVQHFQSAAGIGTHIDAPAHCVPGGRTVDQITLSELITSCVVIDVSSDLRPDFILNPQHIDLFEEQHGTIEQDAFVVVYTGWSQRWPDAVRYRNSYQFPSLSPEASQVLVERGVCGVGIDTLSVDVPSRGFLSHGIILGADKYIVENIPHTVTHLPPVGSRIIIAPLKIEGGTEAPVRLIAEVPVHE